MQGRSRRIIDVALATCLLLLLALLVGRWQSGAERVLAGNARAIDGDSLVVAGERVRLEGIDAPELDQVCSRDGADFACGTEARAVLSGLLTAGDLLCKGSELDRYGRLLAQCTVSGRDLAHAMVEAGWAVAFGNHVAGENVARDAKRGLWAGEFDRPADWRRAHGKPDEQTRAGLWGWLLAWLAG